MNVQRFTPSQPLIPYVKEYIIIESDVDVSNKTLPDTSLVMTFRYRGAVLRVENDVKERLPSSAIAGLRKSVRYFYYEKSTSNFIVVFNESGLTPFCKLPAHELFGLSVSTENVFSSEEIDEVLERLSESKNHRQRVVIIETMLLSKITERKRDSLVEEAIARIKQSNGLIRMNELAGGLHTSQDPFEKRFRASVGSSPKQYATIIRLRRVIENYSPDTSLTETALQAGYFDQSHFIKDFRLFTGQAPKDFFKTSDFW